MGRQTRVMRTSKPGIGAILFFSGSQRIASFQLATCDALLMPRRAAAGHHRPSSSAAGACISQQLCLPATAHTVCAPFSTSTAAPRLCLEPRGELAACPKLERICI